MNSQLQKKKRKRKAIIGQFIAGTKRAQKRSDLKRACTHTDAEAKRAPATIRVASVSLSLSNGPEYISAAGLVHLYLYIRVLRRVFATARRHNSSPRRLFLHSERHRPAAPYPLSIVLSGYKSMAAGRKMGGQGSARLG